MLSEDDKLRREFLTRYLYELFMAVGGDGRRAAAAFTEDFSAAVGDLAAKFFESAGKPMASAVIGQVLQEVERHGGFVKMAGSLWKGIKKQYDRGVEANAAHARRR